MRFTNLHQNFILLAPLSIKQPLENRAFWPAFINEINLFSGKIKGIPRIGASQYDGNGEVKLGRLSWRAEKLQKLADNYYLSAQPEAFDFPYFFANFPSPVTCSKQDTTPALTLTLDDATSGGLPQSGLLLSFRQDYFDELGETVVHELLNRLSALLQAGLRLRKQTQYAYPYKESLSDVWQDCIMDLFPTHAAELTKKGWEIKKDFAGWAKF